MDKTKTINYKEDEYSDYRLNGSLSQISQSWEGDDAKDITTFTWKLNHQNYLKCAFLVEDKKHYMYDMTYK